MRVVLVSSRSFGQIVDVGINSLTSAGFEIRRISEKARPLDAVKLARIVRHERPHALICGAEPITADVLSASDNLQLVVKHGVGVDNIDIEFATAKGILVANTPDTNTEAVADLTIGLMLVLLRHICKANTTTHQGKWERFIGHELGALRVGVVGTGRIGGAVIKRLHAFGPEILAYDVNPREELVSKYGVRYVSLEELLATSDIVTLHVPLTEKTRNMIGARELDQMKIGACLINVARGGIVDEKALYDRLKSKRIAAAALDVFTEEPPRANPLLQLDNVIATPHIGAYTYEAIERMDRLCASIIIEVFTRGYSPYILNPNAQGPKTL